MKDVLRARRRAVRPPPAGHGAGRGAGVRRRPSASRWSRSRPPAPARRRPSGSTTPTRCAAGSRPCRRGPEAPALLEEFVVGEEHSFDSVIVGGADRLAVDRRLPAAAARGAAQPVDPVDRAPAARDRRPALRRDPRRRARGARALGMRDGLSHMEWFRRPDGSVAVSEVGARPPGAQIDARCSLRARRRLLPRVGRARGPRRSSSRRSAATPRVRLPARPGQGPGPRRARPRGGARRIGHLVVEARLPQPGSRPPSDYEGDGYVIVRHPDTDGRRGRSAADRRGSPGGARGGTVNVLMLSPGYPAEMPFFTRALAAVGATVIGVGDQPPQALPPMARERSRTTCRSSRWDEDGRARGPARPGARTSASTASSACGSRA